MYKRIKQHFIINQVFLFYKLNKKSILAMNGKDPIEEELGKAGVAPSVPPSVVRLDKFRIMSDTDVPPEEFLMRLFGKPCFPRRDISTGNALLQD